MINLVSIYRICVCRELNPNHLYHHSDVKKTSLKGENFLITCVT